MVTGRGDVSFGILRFLAFILAVCLLPAAVESSGEFGFRFVIWPEWHVVSGGDEIRLSCTINLGSDTIRWQHNHRFIDSGVPWPGDEYSPRVIAKSHKESHLVMRIAQDGRISKMQEGLYQCVASVGAIAVTSLPGQIEVAYLRPFVNAAPAGITAVDVDEGDVFIVPCSRPPSLPEAKLQFYKEDHLLDLSDENKYHVTQAGDLLVLNSEMSSSGEYSCRAYNPYLSRIIDYPTRTSVTVRPFQEFKGVTSTLPEESPRLISFDSVVRAPIGEPAQFVCAALNNRPSHLYWSRKGSDVTLGDVKEKKAVAMVIRKISANDEGVYRCHGNNSKGASVADVTLFVQESPYVIRGPKSEAAYEDSNVTLDCQFGGKPAPAVAWVFNGQLLINADNIRLQGNRLELGPMRKNQAGVYQCFAFNPFGSAQETTIVTVTPKTVTAAPTEPRQMTDLSGPLREIDLILVSEPDERKPMKEKKKKGRRKKKKKKKKKKKNRIENMNGIGEMRSKPKSEIAQMLSPTRPNVTKISDESVMVTWQVEEGVGIDILFFKVQYRTDDQAGFVGHRWRTVDEDIPDDVRSYEVTALKYNHAYRFRVLAVYENYDNLPGPSSKIFFLEKDIKLKSPQTPPKILYLLPMHDTSVSIFWEYNSQTKTEGFIINYRMSTSAADYTKIPLVGPELRNHVIHHLDADTAYDFKICSFNMAGTSDFSERETYIPKGMNTTSELTTTTSADTTDIDIVISDPEGILDSQHLYILLGAGIGFLLLIVVVSSIIYSCRNRNREEELPDDGSKFTDTSLRIHRLSSADIRTPHGDKCQCNANAETGVPLLGKQQNPTNDNINAINPLSGRQYPPCQSSRTPPIVRKMNNHNGNVNMLKETSFVGNDQPCNVFRANSMHSTFKS